MQNNNIRRDLKAGSWYEKDPTQLNNELQGWLDSCQKKSDQNCSKVKGIIGPHAGLRYCGETGAWSYQYLQPQKDLRVFLLGPSHQLRMYCCGLTKFDQFQTPLGSIQVDQDCIKKLKEEAAVYEQQNALDEQLFQDLSGDSDEAEHSLELHLPWIQKMLKDQPFKLVPIMVGQLTIKEQAHYGKLLAPYFDDENTIFLISSDFCHWGSRFRFTSYDQRQGEIHKSIKKMDNDGMDIIETHDAEKFDSYLQNTGNTICGRRPIGIFLQIISFSKSRDQLETKFQYYDQSSQCKDMSDSSVSYAASVTYIKKK